MNITQRRVTNMHDPKDPPRLSGQDALRITNLVMSASHHPIATSPIELDPEYVRQVCNTLAERLERELLIVDEETWLKTPRDAVDAIPAETVAVERRADGRIVRTVRLLDD